MRGRSQAEEYLTRRTFLEVALLGGTLALLDGCGRLPGRSIAKGVAPSSALGLLELTDAVSIHPYRNQPPETAVSDYQCLRTLIARYAPPGKDNTPIVSSEWGYPVIEKLPQASQAAFFVREYLTNVINGVLLSIWYDWNDDGPDPQNSQDNFGIVTWDNQPKIAYLAAQALTKQLSGFHFAEHLALSSARDYAIAFAQNTMKKLVLWTVDSPHTITLSVNAPAVTVVGMTGEVRTLNTRSGALMIT